MVLTASLLLVLASCAEVRDQPEDPDPWYSDGMALDVTEVVPFTDEPYPDFGAPDQVDDLYGPVFPTGSSDYVNPIVFGPDEHLPDNDCDFAHDDDLPLEIEGVVTVHPRFYFKTIGCEGDEKYYGSYFVEDASGGAFVLGDSKVAHFDMGDRVRLRIRGARTSFGLDMVYAHDVLDVVRGPQPIYYQEPDGPLGAGHVARVQRVTGTVVTELGTFGDFQVEADDGTVYDMQLDTELSRRGYAWPVGSRLTVTGPVLFSYDVYSIVITRVGQVTTHD